MTDTPVPDIRELAKGPLLLALHDLNVRIAGLRPDEPDLCHCGLVAEVALDALIPAVEPVIRRQVAEELASIFDEKVTQHGHPRRSLCHYAEVADTIRSHSTQPETGQDHG